MIDIKKTNFDLTYTAVLVFPSALYSCPHLDREPAGTIHSLKLNSTGVQPSVTSPTVMSFLPWKTHCYGCKTKLPLIPRFYTLMCQSFNLLSVLCPTLFINSLWTSPSLKHQCSDMGQQSSFSSWVVTWIRPSRQSGISDMCALLGCCEHQEAWSPMHKPYTSIQGRSFVFCIMTNTNWTKYCLRLKVQKNKTSFRLYNLHIK